MRGLRYTAGGGSLNKLVQSSHEGCETDRYYWIDTLEECCGSDGQCVKMLQLPQALKSMLAPFLLRERSRGLGPWSLFLPVFPTGQVGQAVAKPSLAYGNSLGPGLARAYRLCKA